MKNKVVLVTNNRMGNADEKPQQLSFGKYVCEGSPVSEGLRTIESNGTRLVICSTCLNHFNVAEKVQVGIVGGMGDILEAQMKADKVITI